MNTKPDMRERLRALQDELIVAAERRGYGPHARVSRHLPESVTLAALRGCIYPDHEGEFRVVLATLKEER